MPLPLIAISTIITTVYKLVELRHRKKENTVTFEQLTKEISMGKKWYLSKTFWVNTIAVIAIAVQGQVGYVVSPELQTYVLVGLNFVLRVITKEQVIW